MGPIVTIIHAPALKAREQHVRNMCQAFSQCGATVVIVMGPEPPVADPVALSTMVNMDPSKLGDITMTSVFRPLLQDMKVRQLSNGLKHAAAIQYIAAQDHPSDSWHVILEDDAMIVDASALLKSCDGAPSDADMMFFGFPSAMPHPPVDAVRYDPLPGITLLPSCDCYAIKMHTARFLSTAILPIRFRTEIHLSWLISNTSIKTYISSPNLSVDGSKAGMFVSTIESNNTLCFNAEYVELSNMETDPQTTTHMKNTIETFIARVKSMPYSDHPDVQVMLANRLASVGRFDDAINIFASALAIYESEGAVIGNDSAFMRVYMSLFRHKQDDI